MEVNAEIEIEVAKSVLVEVASRVTVETKHFVVVCVAVTVDPPVVVVAISVMVLNWVVVDVNGASDTVVVDVIIKGKQLVKFFNGQTKSAGNLSNPVGTSLGVCNGTTTLQV